MDDIKDFFDFEWKLPELKLPHITIGGYIDVPVLGTIPDPNQIYVDWYRKAMDQPMILDNPTIFGAAGGKLLGAGEAGPEVVSGLGSLLGMIQQAVRSVQQATNITQNKPSKMKSNIWQCGNIPKICQNKNITTHSLKMIVPNMNLL